MQENVPDLINGSGRVPVPLGCLFFAAEGVAGDKIFGDAALHTTPAHEAINNECQPASNAERCVLIGALANDMLK
jgi:hypothetical protein